MAEQFDLIVLGTGTAARSVATRTRKAGAVIDYRPFGGTCALRGCDPKKVLVGAASLMDHARRMRGKGIAGAPDIDWPELIAFKRSFTESVPRRNKESYAEKGIASFQGRARFTGEKSVEVGGTHLKARHILIATGATPMRLGIPGEEHLVTSEEFLELGALPKRIVMVGGGYIAAEFSHVAARAGSQVTVLQRGPRMLTHFEPELVGWLMQKFEAIGIDVRTQTSVEAVEKTDGGYRVRAKSEGSEIVIEADLVVHAAGRVPHLHDLDLARAGIVVEEGHLKLNEFLQSTSNPAVYAAGDAAQAGPPLTPTASQDGKVVASNLVDGNHVRPDYRGIPSVAFTVPPIAAVGLGEEEAREQGLSFTTSLQSASGWFSARHTGEGVYGFKTLVEDETGRILGAHLVGPHADEVINLFALAIRQGLTANALKNAIFAYPTGASDIESMLP